MFRSTSETQTHICKFLYGKFYYDTTDGTQLSLLFVLTAQKKYQRNGF